MRELKNLLQNLTIIKGNSYSIRSIAYNREADFSDAPETLTDTVKNVTGFTAKFVVKRNKEDADSAAIFEVTGVLTTPASGIIDFILSKTNTAQTTGQYWYEAYIYDSTTRNTLNLGQFNIIDNVKDTV